ncbi:MAG: NADH-quinone oxidoreductase subunit N [Anaerolineaceae bacterium]|nr:NADH-quinone oxidoreductase subunit N [Anaerolineaceae bacterium]
MTGGSESMLLAILPEIGLLVLVGLVLTVDLIWAKERKGTLGWVTFIGLLVISIVTLIFVRPPEEAQLIFGGMLRFDEAGYIFRLIFIAGAALTALFALECDGLERGEFYILLLVSTFGMSLMASSSDLVMLYLAVETASIPLFVLAGFLVKEKKSVEAGIKYLLFGAMASAIMLYGFTLLYGFSGTTQIYDIAAQLLSNEIPALPMTTAILLVMIGFGFKASIAPFHFWAPDVYEGAPTPVTGFLSTASKAAGFAVLIRVLTVVFPDIASTWTLFLAVLATLSMFIGNYLALVQKNIKRMLAFSSISHAGYILLGLAAGSSFGISATIYYLIAYLVTNLAAFGVITIAGRTLGSDQISAYAGLSRRSPALALAMLVAILSLGGIPPFAGFIAKLLVFSAVIEANMVWLAFVGIFNAVIALYYYLNVLKVMYLFRSEDEDKPVPIAKPWKLALVICVLGIFVVGTIIAPWFSWAGAAATSFLGI